MVVIELHRPKYEPQAQAVSRELVARIEVDAKTGLRVVDGDPEWRHIADIVVNHPHTKDNLVYADDPELWAMTVPEAFRSEVVATAFQETLDAKRRASSRYAVGSR